jgi:Nucleotidyltransferase domain
MFNDMNKPNVENITRDHQFDSETFDKLVSEAYEVAIFGSRAAGVHRPDSDTDLLIVTPHKRRIFAVGLDCVLLSPEEVGNSFWLGSELASHIARYGNWIKGVGRWRSNVQISDRAIVRKQKRISSLLNVVDRWSQLHPIFHMKYRTMLRREVQRLMLLSTYETIPPTAVLDAEWQANLYSTDSLQQFLLGIESFKLRSGQLKLVLNP